MKNLLFIFVLFITSAHAYSSTREEILNQVHQYTESMILEAHPMANRYKINIRQPDPRFSFENCLNPELTHTGNQLRARILIKIACGNSNAIHVAVDVAVFKGVLISNIAIARKTLLTAADISFKEVNILTNTRAMILDESQAIGKALKRAIRAGTVISPGMLTLPVLINRGDSVVIIAKKGPLIVRVAGTALASGTMGQQIAVRNSSSERTVKGWVRGPGEIFVPM